MFRDKFESPDDQLVNYEIFLGELKKILKIDDSEVDEIFYKGSCLRQRKRFFSYLL